MSVEEDSMRMASSYLQALLRASRSLAQAGKEGLSMAAALYRFQKDVRLGRVGRKSFSGKYGLARNCSSLSFLVIPDQKGPDGELSASATRSLMNRFTHELKQCGISYAYTNKSFAPDGVGTTIAIDGAKMEAVMAILQQKEFHDAGIDFPKALGRENFDARYASPEDSARSRQTYNPETRTAEGNQRTEPGMESPERASSAARSRQPSKVYAPTEKQKDYLRSSLEGHGFTRDQAEDWLNCISAAEASGMLTALGDPEILFKPGQNLPLPSGFDPVHPSGPSAAQRMNHYQERPGGKAEKSPGSRDADPASRTSRSPAHPDPIPGGGTAKFADRVNDAKKAVDALPKPERTKGPKTHALGE